MAYIALMWFVAFFFIVSGSIENKNGDNIRKQIFYTGLGIIFLVATSAMAIIDALKPR